MVTYLSAASLVVALWFVKKLADFVSGNRRKAPYPPGPKPLPLIGNLLDFPADRVHEVYIEWAKKYQSDFIYASALGNKVLIINKLEDADELLERRARITSDRPDMPMLRLVGWEYNFGFMPYGKFWRLHRRITQQNFRPEGVRNYHPVILEKVGQMLNRLLVDPDHFETHSKMLSISIPMKTMYGYDVESFEDPAIDAAEKGVTGGGALLVPGATLITIIPALGKIPIPTWLPGASTWRKAAEVRKLSETAERIPFEFVEKRVAQGIYDDSLVSKYLRKKAESGLSAEEERAIRNIGMTVYGGASDTTISLTGSFFYLMATHPDIQRKAQAEIDLVVGNSRLPDFSDRPSLPYLDAIFREVARIAPPIPISIPHVVTEDDIYKGYYIPKNTAILANIWAMTHDEETYPEPYKFKPERFYDESGQLNTNSRVLAFGFGRRVCVGQHIGSATMFIIIATVLSCFNIGKKKDASGNEIEIDPSYIDYGVLRHKAHFECSIVPRSPKAEQLIKEAKFFG